MLPLARSLWDNHIGDEGVTMLAAVLKETKISTLECAPPRQSVCFVSAPVDTLLTRLLSHRVPPPPLAYSLAQNEIGDEGASALAAILKETQITKLMCAAAPPKCLQTLFLFP